MSNYSLERMDGTHGREAYFSSHRSIQGRQLEKSILEKHTLFPCWSQGSAIAPHQESARASSKLIPPKEEKKTAVEQLTNSTTFEVEFSDRNERTFESIGLRPEQIMVLILPPHQSVAKSVLSGLCFLVGRMHGVKLQ